MPLWSIGICCSRLFFLIRISFLYFFFSTDFCVLYISSCAGRQIGWLADDPGSLLIIEAAPLFRRPGLAIKTCAHTLENGFSRALSISSIVKTFYRTSRNEMAVRLQQKTIIIADDDQTGFNLLIEFSTTWSID